MTAGMTDSNLPNIHLFQLASSDLYKFLKVEELIFQSIKEFICHCPDNAPDFEIIVRNTKFILSNSQND